MKYIVMAKTGGYARSCFKDFCRHENAEDAEREAMRLALKEGVPFFVLRPVAVARPPNPPAVLTRFYEDAAPFGEPAS